MLNQTAHKSHRAQIVTLIGAFALTTLLSSACRPEPTAEQILNNAIGYLIQQQGSDGGWHSDTHGLLRGGQAATPYVMHQLLNAKRFAEADVDHVITNGASFLRTHLRDDGALGFSDSDVLEYPNYSTAYALMVFTQLNAQFGSPEDAAVTEGMTNYLLQQQFNPSRGIDSTMLAFGSWGFGENLLPHGVTGHLDLSHTRRVLQALRSQSTASLESPELNAAFNRAQTFLGLLQKSPDDARIVLGSLPQNTAKYDGGFYASPLVHGTNKAGIEQADSTTAPFFRSYASTTCDGILALLAAGVDLNDDRIQNALTWLRDHPKWDRPEGIPPGEVGDWEKVLFFYHLSVRAQTYNAVGFAEPWTEAVVALLAEKQKPDGSFSNPFGAPNKEDDPILATAMAMSALISVLEFRTR